MPDREETGLRTKGVFEEGATPLYQFATEGLHLPTRVESLQAKYGAITEERARRAEERVKPTKEKAAGIATLAAEQSEERKRERPAPVEPPQTPDLGARPFLTPPASVLGQLQMALIGIGQIAQGVGGLKGKGYAIGATTALKGALEGWQAGDQERAQRAFEQWQVETQRLLAAHRSRRERYQDILDDHKRTMDARLADLVLDARIAEIEDLPQRIRQEGIEGALGWMEKARAQEIQLATLTHSIVRDQRNFEALQGHRAVLEKEAAARLKIAQERLGIYRETATPIIKLENRAQTLEDYLDRRLPDLRSAVKMLNDAGLLVRGPTWGDWLRPKAERQTQFGDERLQDAFETLRRWGTALLIGAEYQMMGQAGTFRIKNLAEAEAGDVLSIPASFWNRWLDNREDFFGKEYKRIISHLSASKRPGPPPEAAEAGPIMLTDEDF